jgi:hypothetical protein
MDEDEMFDKSGLCEMKMEVDWLAWRLVDLRGGLVMRMIWARFNSGLIKVQDADVSEKRRLLKLEEERERA